MEDSKLLVDLIALLGGAFLSLFFAIIPGVKEWYQGQRDELKRLIMLVALALMSALVYFLNCQGWLVILLPGLPLSLSCDTVGGLLMVRAFFLALISNQGMFLLAVKGFGKDASKDPAPVG